MRFHPVSEKSRPLGPGRGCAWATLVLGVLLACSAVAQPPQPGNIRLNLQGEVKLGALIDYVSQRLQMQFIYSPTMGNRRVNVRSPKELPVTSLLPLLGAVLKSEKMALVQADLPGFYRITDAKEMLGAAEAGDAERVLTEKGPATPVTEAFVLRHSSAKEMSQLLRPFLTTTGSSLIALTDSNVLVVTDYSKTVLQIKRLIDVIDQPRGDLTIEFYTVEHLPAAKLAEQIRAMLGVRQSANGASPAGGTARERAELFEELRTNQIVVVGSRDDVEEALGLLKRFDVSLGLVTQVYRFTHIQAERFHKLAQGFLAAQDSDRLYSGSVDSEGNLLLVRATPEVHERLADLLEQVDVPIEVERSPIRFYKLKNANVMDVLYTLLALQEAGGEGATGMAADGTAILGPGQAGAMGGADVGSLTGGRELTGSRPLPTGAGARSIANATGQQAFSMPLGPESRPDRYDNQMQARQQRIDGATSSQFALGGTANLPGRARVSADPTTNSLIVVAPPESHEMYSKLILQLDKRKPQVMIDAKIIAVDTTDNFQLGVEVSGGDRTPLKRIFAFTSYGLSQVNPITGALQILPAAGFNGTLVDPSVADVVVQALASHARARVLASPRILVNDNSTGQLESVASVPFQSVNASNTVSTTSLGGNQQAGTVITVTPHINENNHLLLEFEVEFSTFVGNAQASSLPPPRQIDRVGSTVTIPDGQTIIVGGLRRSGDQNGVTGLPYISELPILRALSGFQTRRAETTSFFLFIRPLILHDDQFADLRYMSQKAARAADAGASHPVARPIMIDP